MLVSARVLVGIIHFLISESKCLYCFTPNFFFPSAQVLCFPHSVSLVSLLSHWRLLSRPIYPLFSIPPVEFSTLTERTSRCWQRGIFWDYISDIFLHIATSHITAQPSTCKHGSLERQLGKYKTDVKQQSVVRKLYFFPFPFSLLNKISAARINHQFGWFMTQDIT